MRCSIKKTDANNNNRGILFIKNKLANQLKNNAEQYILEVLSELTKYKKNKTGISKGFTIHCKILFSFLF